MKKAKYSKLYNFSTMSTVPVKIKSTAAGEKKVQNVNRSILDKAGGKGVYFSPTIKH